MLFWGRPPGDLPNAVRKGAAAGRNVTKMTADARFRASSVTFREERGAASGASGTLRRAGATALDFSFIRQGRPDEILHFKESRRDWTVAS